MADISLSAKTGKHRYITKTINTLKVGEATKTRWIKIVERKETFWNKLTIATYFPPWRHLLKMFSCYRPSLAATKIVFNLLQHLVFIAFVHLPPLSVSWIYWLTSIKQNMVEWCDVASVIRKLKGSCFLRVLLAHPQETQKPCHELLSWKNSSNERSRTTNICVRKLGSGCPSRVKTSHKTTAIIILVWNAWESWDRSTQLRGAQIADSHT